MSVCVTSQAGVAMSISHMPKPSSIMQGLPHHLQSSLVQNNVFGMDNAHRNLDEPNPDMLLALLARNKALEGVNSFTRIVDFSENEFQAISQRKT
ncbi:hypothetical protein Bhyg_02728 [Pseudolycoriella hygida]|uniref:Uncharacterized protein n=1 Tax=Pseudolycoriella hygida TaxID=35572 RepID=A0A9Q0NBY9_9DIPT|nr:hypothetical protein Bhyg_02728 [Pseudolycoriella hygida]